MSKPFAIAGSTELGDSVIDSIAALLLAAAERALAGGRGGTECAVEGCHEQATEACEIDGRLVHLCAKHAAEQQPYR